MPPVEPIWCAFCQDRPMVGRMIVMVDGTTEQVAAINEEEGAACDMCGRSWTGAKIAEHEEDGRVAVLQYEHPDFAKITEKHIQELSAVHTCSECGNPTEVLPLWMAERVLRANPRLVLNNEFEAICVSCADKYFSDDPDDVQVDDQDSV